MSNAMGIEEELELAKRRWGPRAVVFVEETHDAEGSSYVCSVGCRGHDAHSWDALGVGATFELAFADAEEREATSRRRNAANR
jgi:hypothetical protein